MFNLFVLRKIYYFSPSNTTVSLAKFNFVKSKAFFLIFFVEFNVNNLGVRVFPRTLTSGLRLKNSYLHPALRFGISAT